MPGSCSPSHGDIQLTDKAHNTDQFDQQSRLVQRYFGGFSKVGRLSKLAEIEARSEQITGETTN